MQAFIPREKLSKKARRKLDRAKRTSWGGVNPVTRKAPDKTIYDRKKPDCRFIDTDSRIIICRVA